jgi:hypothetical protein
MTTCRSIAVYRIDPRNQLISSKLTYLASFAVYNRDSLWICIEPCIHLSNSEGKQR